MQLNIFEQSKTKNVYYLQKEENKDPFLEITILKNVLIFPGILKINELMNSANN